jgi:Uma2 family endonuclease
VYLAIEVMDSSARYDRGEKLAKYARSGLAEVWLVDIGRERIEVYRRPNGEDYDEKRTLARGESLAPEAFPDAVLAVDAILG